MGSDAWAAQDRVFRAEQRCRILTDTAQMNHPAPGPATRAVITALDQFRAAPFDDQAATVGLLEHATRGLSRAGTMNLVGVLVVFWWTVAGAMGGAVWVEPTLSYFFAGAAVGFVTGVAARWGLFAVCRSPQEWADTARTYADELSAQLREKPETT